MLGVYTRWFNDWALLVGWAVGTVAGTAMAIAAKLAPSYPLAIGGHTFPGYTALYTVVLNLVVVIVLTPLFRAMRAGSANWTRPSRPIIGRDGLIVRRVRHAASGAARHNEEQPNAAKLALPRGSWQIRRSAAN